MTKSVNTLFQMLFLYEGQMGFAPIHCLLCLQLYIATLCMGDK